MAEVLTSPRSDGRGGDHEGRRPRIAHLTTVDMSLALLLSTELAVDVEHGYDVYGISAPGPHVAAVRELGVEHVPVPSLTRSWDPRADALAARELWGVIRALDLDVLHTHNPKTGVLGRILGRAAGVPVVVNTCHGLWATADDPWARRVAVLVAEAVAARFSDAELYQNEDDRRTMRRLGVRHQATVGNGTDLARFRPDPTGRARVRRELGIGDEVVLVGGVGRRVAEKGLLEFAAAARSLAGRAEFIWVGPDDDAKSDAVSGEVDGVRHLGMRRDMPATYAAIDVFVLPSHREGFSRSAMEAAACGRPMVLTDIRGCREIGRHDQEVLLVPPRDADALTAAVARLIDDEAMRDRLADAARRRAMDAFDQRRVATASIATYRDVAGRRGERW